MNSLRVIEDKLNDLDYDFENCKNEGEYKEICNELILDNEEEKVPNGFVSAKFKHNNITLNGYKLKDGKLVIVKEQADIIKKIFNMRSKGNKLIEISKDVGMSKQRISKILKNKTYTGKYSYDGKWKSTRNRRRRS